MVSLSQSHRDRSWVIEFLLSTDLVNKVCRASRWAGRQVGRQSVVGESNNNNKCVRAK